MEKKQKGRPPKGERIAKKEHFSVWVSKDQKALINEKIQRSGLSASQYFLTQVLDTPIKRPQLKVLPRQTAELYKVLRMLSGQFALAVLRASQADMLSRQWQESSQNISLVSKLIMQWVYEDFEVRSFRQTLTDINEWTRQIYGYLEKVLPTAESKTGILETAARLRHKSQELLEKYEVHYLRDEAPNDLAVWQDEKPDPRIPVHDVIKETMEQLLKQRKL
ncbi:plasmid mobilization protein [Dyadobacter frigoris]|uniref:plasmid mobilization protein n=1 Tax=Dyadobacter frigoris TaxID=2576211 RepID=UPI0026B8522D